MPNDTIIWKLTEEQKLKNHIPEEVWKLSRTNEVYIEDYETGELIEIVDLRDNDGAFKTLALRKK